MFQHAFVLLMIMAQAPVAPATGVSLGDAARRIRAERQVEEAAQDEMVNHVLRVSGLDKQIDAFPKDLSEAFNRQMVRLDPRFSERYQKAVFASFTAAKIRSTFADTFKRQMGNSALSGVLPWFESPVGRKVTAAEAPDPDAATHARNLTEFVARIQKEPPSPHRIRLIREMEAQVQQTDHMAGIMLAMVRALVSNIRSSDPRRVLPVDLVNSPDFEKGFRDVLVPELAKQNALSDLYVYSTLSDAELEQYVQFLSSPHGQTMNRAVWSGFEQTLVTSMVEVASRLGDLSQAPAEP